MSKETCQSERLATSFPAARNVLCIILALYLNLATAVSSPSASILSSLSRTLRGDIARGRTPVPESSQSPETNQNAAFDRLRKNTTLYTLVTVKNAPHPAGKTWGPAPTMTPSPNQGRKQRPEITCARKPRHSVVRFPGCLPQTIDVGTCQGSCLRGGDFLTGNLTVGSDDVYRFPATSSRHCRCCKIVNRVVRSFQFICTPPPDYEGKEAMIRAFINIEIVGGCRCRKCFFRRPS